LDLMARMGQMLRLPAVAQRVAVELREHNLPEAAAELEREVKAALEAAGLSFEAATRGARTSLPTKCPSCGGNVIPAELEWVGNQRALCAYCGSPMTPVE
jgi:hypothetical protein